MYKYAEIYGGKVRDLKESNLGYTEFVSIFDPTSYWIDVTGVTDIDVDYVIKFSKDVGTYFEKPEELVTVETLDSKILGKLEKLKVLFERALDNAYIESSLGFRANADKTAYNNVDALIIEATEENSIIEFNDYDNLKQYLSVDQLKVLKTEIAKNNSFLYRQKFKYRDDINDAATEEELEAIVISFENMSFDIAD
jgi:hypothetical protein